MALFIIHSVSPFQPQHISCYLHPCFEGVNGQSFKKYFLRLCLTYEKNPQSVGIFTNFSVLMGSSVSVPLSDKRRHFATQGDKNSKKLRLSLASAGIGSLGIHSRRCHICPYQAEKCRQRDKFLKINFPVRGVHRVTSNLLHPGNTAKMTENPKNILFAVCDIM